MAGEKRVVRAMALLLTVVLASGVVRAFDAADWHGKRELFAREAERLMAVYATCTKHLDSPAETVTIPVETFEDGSVKILINAEKAQYFLKQGYVWAENVVVRRFGPDGKVIARIDARNCLVDRKSKSGWVAGKARIQQDKMTFIGKRVYFSAEDAYVKVYEESEVESQDLKIGEVMR